MSEVQKQLEELQWASAEDLEKGVTTAGEKPAEVVKALQEDTVTQKILGNIRTLKDLPQTMLMGQTMWLMKWAGSALEGTKNLLVGTGEFIGVWAAKLVHEWGDSLLQYANEKTQGIRDIVNVAGEAIAVTAFEAMHGDRSVIMGAVRYWKEQGVEIAKLPPEKQVELMASFQAQVAMGAVGSKGLGAASKTATLSNEISLGWKALDKAVSISAKIGAETVGLDSGALKKADITGNVVPIHSEKRHSAGKWEPEKSEVSARGTLYSSRFSNNAPESLKKENPMAWIDKDGTISYNKEHLEQEFWVKIEGETGKTTIDGKSLKAYIKENPENWEAIMEKLKNLKWHESTHRLLESHGVERMSIAHPDGTSRIYGQEEICHIVDGSLPIAKEEFVLLEEALQKKLWPNFKLDSHQIRIADTKNIADSSNGSERFRRQKEAASSGNGMRETYASRDIKSIVNNGDFAEQTKFLQEATPEEIGTALNHGLIDYAADEFSAEFTNALQGIVQLYEKNTTNTWGVRKDFEKIIKEASNDPDFTSAERDMLEGIVRRIHSAGEGVDFKEGFHSLSQSSELSSLVKSLPESVTKAEGLEALEGSIARLAAFPTNQKDCLTAIDAFIKKFPDSTKEWALLAIEHTDPALWKEADVFKWALRLSREDLTPLFQRMTSRNPEKIQLLARSWDIWRENAQLHVLQEVAQRSQKLDRVRFQDTFTQGPSREEASKLLGRDADALTDSGLDRVTDYHRLKVLLGEHPDTKALSVSEISSRVGPENLDRFFHFSLERLNKIAQTDPALQKQIDRVVSHYDRDKFSGKLRTAAGDS